MCGVSACVLVCMCKCTVYFCQAVLCLCMSVIVFSAISTKPEYRFDVNRELTFKICF